MADTHTKKYRFIEKPFETALFQCRFFVLLAVLGSMIAAITMFLKGCTELIQAVNAFFPQLLQFQQTTTDDKAVIVSIIPAIDYYLFATVLLMFSMGIYELFISDLDPAIRGKKTKPNWLNFENLEDMKSHIGKVVMMILIVNFFQQAFNITYTVPSDLLYLGGAIFLVALSLLATQNIVFQGRSEQVGAGVRGHLHAAEHDHVEVGGGEASGR